MYAPIAHVRAQALPVCLPRRSALTEQMNKVALVRPPNEHTMPSFTVRSVVAGHHASTTINKYGSEFISMHEYFMCVASIVSPVRVGGSCHLVTARSGVRVEWERARKSDKCRNYLLIAKTSNESEIIIVAVLLRHVPQCVCESADYHLCGVRTTPR